MNNSIIVHHAAGRWEFMERVFRRGVNEMVRLRDKGT